MPKDFFNSPRVAINRTAAMVLDGKGVQFTTTKRILHRHWENQPTTIRYTGNKKHNLTGKRFGHFVVIGLSEFTNTRRQRLWIVKCACGRYETRTAKAIKNPHNSKDRCAICRALDFQKRHEQFRFYGIESHTMG